MKQIKKNILGIVLAAVMVFTSIVGFHTISAEAEETTNTPTVNFVANANDVKAGDTFTVNVNIANNPGIVGIQLSYSFNANLELTAVSDTGLLGGYVAPPVSSDSSYKPGQSALIYNDGLREADNTNNGTVAVLTFKVSENSCGTAKIEERSSTFVNFDLKKVEFDVNSTSISIAHVWDEGTVTTEPTCREGVKTYTCGTCGDTRTEVIPATGTHSWGEGIVTKGATCDTAGEKTYTCGTCHDTKTEVIPATEEHTWNDREVTKDATCEEDGEKTYICGVCGGISTEVIPALGHTWDEGTVITEPTCDEAGVKTYTCTEGCTKTEEIAALGHAWDEGTVVEEATETEEGKMLYTCTVCEETKEEVIPKKGTVVTPGTETENNTNNTTTDTDNDTTASTTVKTGDTSIVMLWVILALASICVGGVVVGMRRKNR